MGSRKITLCAAAFAVTAPLAVSALAPAPYAHAAGVARAGGGVLVSPGSPAPGTDIQVRVQGCTGMTGTAASEAFVADAQLTGKPGALTGETRVRSTLTPGTYDVKVSCDGFEDKVKGAFTVLDKNQREKQKKDEKKDEQRKAEEKREEKGAAEERERQESDGAPTTPASPVAPVHAGGGGSARLAVVDARSEGPGTRHAVIGLVLAGVAAVAVALRSARRGRGSTGGGGTGRTD